MPSGGAGTPLAKITTNTKVCALAVSNYDSSVAIGTSKGGIIIVKDTGNIGRSEDKGFQHPEKTVLQRGGRCISSLVFTHHNEVINFVDWREFGGLVMNCGDNEMHYWLAIINAMKDHSKCSQVFGLD